MVTRMLDYANLLLSCGFRVFANNDASWSYIFFSDGTSIGYVDILWQEFRFCTVHKPSSAYGSNFESHNTPYPTIDDARRTFTFRPSWVKGAVPKHKDLEEFLKSSDHLQELKNDDKTRLVSEP